jgi:putative Mg2+ transporter-C (MgtC) family protein
MTKIDFEIIQILTFFIPKLITATIAGLIIGWERELKNKVAGIRTMVLISVGCAILTGASFMISSIYSESDPSRIIGQIISGIGFLGAGVIVKNDDKITGVTTAAFIWLVSSIGILAGTGAIVTPIVLSFGLIIVSYIFEKLESRIKGNKTNK